MTTEKELIAHYDSHLEYDSPIIHTAKCVDICNQLGILEAPRGMMIDLGCGTGTWVARANSLGFTCIGIDYSPRRIKRAQELHSDYQFHCFRIQDAVSAFVEAPYWTLWDVIEHLENPLDILTKLGGTVWGSVPINFPYVAHLQVYTSMENVCERLQPTRAIEWEYANRPYALLEWKNDS